MGDTISGGGVLARLGHSSAHENFGAQHHPGVKIWSPEKVNLGRYDSTLRSP